jgi:hypothetical protein
MVIGANLICIGGETLCNDWIVLDGFLILGSSSCIPSHNGSIVIGEFLTLDTSPSVSVSDSNLR